MRDARRGEEQDERQDECQDERQDDELVREVVRSARAERACSFAAYLKEGPLDYQYHHRVWITSASAVGRRLGVCDVSANDWLRGKTLPRREQCLRLARACGLPVVAVLVAACDPATQDGPSTTSS
jgi:hypothetical protein